MREAGVSEEGIEQAISIAGFFNYLTRVADATAVEPDYESPVPRIVVDRARAAEPRPPTSKWNAKVDGSVTPEFPRRPKTTSAVERWRAYLLERDEPLTARERRVLARAAAEDVCDAGAVSRWSDAAPATPRERALAAFAGKLSNAPWQMQESDLAPLRAEGLDDRALLHAITVVAGQNAISRMHHGLAALGAGP